MTQPVRFLLGGRVETVEIADPTQTVLQWLRANRRVGTKEGCAEGDCGACTVVVGELADGEAGATIRYRAINSCIQFMPTLDGKQLITVEDLKQPDGRLHPVQQAMVDEHGSQCGFCTPGFVMSLFALFHETGPPPDDTRIHDAIAGNLCRCTGYRPIVAAARRCTAGDRHDRFGEAEAEAIAWLRNLRRDHGLATTGDGKRLIAPTTIAGLAEALAEHPDAVLLAGGTDVGLWVTKEQRRLDPVIYLGDIAELKRVEETPTHLEVGAGATYSDILPLLARHFPSFAEMVRVLGSVQIRNAGTMGGNIANGSPIGDTMPALIALGATVVLNRGGEHREIALEDYYIDYKRTALQPGEFVERIRVPIDVEDRLFATYKVSKRYEQDISAVCAGFAVTLDGGRVARFRAGYGGVAAVPKRAHHLERALIGGPWSLDSVTAALPALDRDFQPITDMRAGKDYRRHVARNLMLKFYLETTEGAGAPRLSRHG